MNGPLPEIIIPPVSLLYTVPSISFCSVISSRFIVAMFTVSVNDRVRISLVRFNENPVNSGLFKFSTNKSTRAALPLLIGIT